MRALSFIIGTLLLSTIAHANESAELLCEIKDDRMDRRESVEVTQVSKTKATLAVGMILMEVNAKDVRPLLEGELEKMNGVILEDKTNGAIVTFKVDGYMFDGKPRLTIDAAADGEETTQLQSCTPRANTAGFNPF